MAKMLEGGRRMRKRCEKETKVGPNLVTTPTCQTTTSDWAKWKQGMWPMLKNRFPTMSAAVVCAIFRQERNLSSTVY